MFPLVALFHLVMLGYSIWNYHTEPFPSVGWVQPLWMLCYAALWLFATGMKKWAAYAYIALVTLNLTLRLVLKSPIALNDFTDALFPMDIIFAMILMAYIKKLE